MWALGVWGFSGGDEGARRRMGVWAFEGRLGFEAERWVGGRGAGKRRSRLQDETRRRRNEEAKRVLSLKSPETATTTFCGKRSLRDQGQPLPGPQPCPITVFLSTGSPRDPKTKEDGDGYKPRRCQTEKIEEARSGLGPAARCGCRARCGGSASRPLLRLDTGPNSLYHGGFGKSVCRARRRLYAEP